MCTTLSVLPKSGGLLDQDKLIIYVFQNIMAWKHQREELDRAKARAKTQ